MHIMSESAAKKTRYSWADYQTWDDDRRWEIIGGEAYLMSPSPMARHQLVSGELQRQMMNYLKGKRCRLLNAPMDVVLSEENVVQPDLLVVCEPEKITRTHIAGAPTLVVEILSDSSAARDRLLKLGLYARYGVAEYWIVTPWPSLVEVPARSRPLRGARRVRQGRPPREPSFSGHGDHAARRV
jgi:Uma2 family endonuclease